MRDALLLSIARLVYTTPWFIVCCAPFYPQRSVSRRAMTVVITLISAAYFCCNFFGRLLMKDFAEYRSLMYIALCVVMFSFFLWVFRVERSKLLYVFVLAQVISAVLNYTAAILLRLYYPGVRITLQDTLFYIPVILLLTCLGVPVLWHFYTHPLRRAADALCNRDFRMLCIPPVLIFLVTLRFNDLGGNPSVLQVQATATFMLIIVAGLGIYFINVGIALNAARRTHLEAHINAIERQLAVQTQSYTQLAQRIEAARTARHDLRHHLAALSSFAKQSDLGGLCKYLSEYQQTLKDENEWKVCDNYTVNAVVQYYLGRAKEAGAELDVKLELPAKLGILDTDLTIVFGNLFENAAQAVAGQTVGRRFISARCGTQHHKLILTVDNSTKPAVHRPKSIKTKYGLGQRSVALVAGKYQGAVCYTQETDVYHASIFMTIPESL